MILWNDGDNGWAEVCVDRVFTVWIGIADEVQRGGTDNKREISLVSGADTVDTDLFVDKVVEARRRDRAMWGRLRSVAIRRSGGDDSCCGK